MDTEPEARTPRRLPDTPLARRLLERREAIHKVVAAHGGTDVRVFGSVARGDGGPDSDLDLLVDLPARTGIFTLGRIARDVERIVGVEADVVPLAAVRSEIRQRVLDEAVPL
ncbi:MAG: nucleotidyltransferase domain-containing protein [Trueperaceae bacterium]|nr:nucleotidyltransferase domain-containing protein [Trueperaceae bacterium]